LLLPLAHLLLLFVPTFLMGASLPLLSHGLVAGTEGAARTVATLYGLNTLGAGMGALVSVWYLIGLLGFPGTIRIGALLNLAAALGALLIARGVGEPAPEAGSKARPAAAQGPRYNVTTWALLYGFSGFVALSLELLWFRALDVMVKSSPYTFGHLLGLYLLFLGLGSLVGTAVVDRIRRPETAFLWGQWAISISAALTLLLLCALPEDAGPLRFLYRYWGRESGLQMWEILDAIRQQGAGRGGALLRQVLTVYVFVPAALLAVPTLLMGLTFAFLQRALQTELREVGWRVGLVQAANILGSLLGSLLTGTLLMGALGTPRSLALLLLVGSVFGALPARGPLAALPVVLSALVALALPSPQRFWARFLGSEPEQSLIAEDATSVASITLEDEGALMRVNGLGHSRLPFGLAHTLIGALPSLIHERAEDVAIIGLGMGGTAWAAGSGPGVLRVRIFEIARPERQVLELLQRRRPVPAVQVLLTDPRFEYRFTDGRLALRTEETRYDVIEADALEPHMAFSGNLYSREFFELVRRRLKPGGILCTYAPTPRTRRTVASVFPHALELSAEGAPRFVVGSEAPRALDQAALLRRLLSPEVQRYFDRSGANPGVTALIESYLARVRASPLTRDTADDLNSDLHPRDEFSRSRPDEPR
jgi:spermidine synthase